MRVRLKHERLARALAERPISLNRWAQLIGLGSGHLSQLANGRRRYPAAATRRKLLDALGLDFDDLFEIVPARASRASKPATPRAGRFNDEGSAEPRPLPASSRRNRAMAGWWLDLRFAVRGLLRRPGFTAASALTLALGIGANLALFTVVNAVLLKALPYQDPERLYIAFSVQEAREGRSSFSWLDYRDLQERLDGVLDLAVFDWEPFSLAGGDRPIRVGGGRVTANFARTVGVDMVLGRFFTEAERQSDQALLVIGEGLWHASFGSDPAIVGREVLLDGRTATIIGVAPDRLDVIDDCRLFVPLRTASGPTSRDRHFLGGFARLAPDVTERQARDRLRAAAAALEREHPRTNEGRSADIEPMRDARVGDIRALMLLLLGMAIAVLLIVCANVANLQLARGASRAPEIGIRIALGADRWRLLRHLMVEIILLTAIGLGIGAMVAVAGARGLLAMVPAASLPAWIDLAPDFRVAGFALAIACAAMALFGSVPAWIETRQRGLGPRAGRSGGRGRTRRILVAAQVALCCALLVGAGLMLRSLSRLMAADTGLRTEGALVVGLDLLSLRNEERDVVTERFLEFYRALEAIPGVEAVGVIDRMPLSGGVNSVGLTIERSGVEDYDPFVLLSRVTPGYFEAAGLPLHEGASFSLQPEGDRDQVIVSRRLAEAFWPEGSAIGKRFKIGRPDDDRPWLTIRGVVGDVRHLGLDRIPRPTVYTTERAIGMTRGRWIIRAARNPAALADDVRNAVASIDPNQPLWGVRSLDDYVANAAWQERFFTVISWSLAALATLLAAIGLYGVLAYAVQQRRHEMGVRLALGATAGEVSRLIRGEGLRLVAIGLLVGLPGALLIGRALAGVLYGIDAVDPMVLGGVLALVMLVGLLAASLPARRAAAVEPAVTLRSDG